MAQTPTPQPPRGTVSPRITSGAGSETREPPLETALERKERAAREEREARDQAEAATAHLGSPGRPGAPPLTPGEAGEPGEPTVKMNFPHPVTLTLPGYRMVRFAEGVQDVPQSLADEEYLAQSGATKV